MERTFDTGAAAAQAPALRWAALISAAFWVHYFLVHDVFGLLTVDEIFFSHVFWLMANGLEPYADFYSAHLPAYFHLLGVFVPGKPGADLSFVWALKATNLAVAGAYAWLLYRLGRREFLFLLPFLFMFIPLARMAEIRPDTFGLLLLNGGWWMLLRGTAPKRMAVAAALALLALFFSARAAIVVAGFGLVLLYLCYHKREWSAFRLLALVAAAFVALVGVIYAADPAGFELMVRSVYLAPVPYLPTVPLWQRVLPLDRLLLVSLIVTAFVAAASRLRRGFDERAFVIAGACATQIVLILIDPSPFQYVYGWAMLPVLAGLGLLIDRFGRAAIRGLTAAAAAVTIALFSVAVGALASGNVPRPGSFLRITYDRPIPDSALEKMSLDELLSLMVTTERQEGLWNQLPLYSEICRRVDGPVLSKFFANPICLPDTHYDWAGMRWPDVLAGEPALSPRPEFERIMAVARPRFVAWGKQHYTPPLSPWGRTLLRDYEIHDGFALRRVADEPRPGASTR